MSSKILNSCSKYYARMEKLCIILSDSVFCCLAFWRITGLDNKPQMGFNNLTLEF